MGKIKWAHFSDLHLNRTGVETKRLRRKLLPYLQQLNVSCDYVFCTGDIRYAPDGGFPSDAAFSISKLCDAVDVTLDRFFIVPGNHDVNRSSLNREEATTRLLGYYDPQHGTIAQGDLHDIYHSREEYIGFIKKLYSDYPDRIKQYCRPQQPHFLVKTDKVNIVHLDSTLVYTATRNNDLIVGSDLLQRLLDELDSKMNTIVLTHYSFDFLRRDEQKQIVALFRDCDVRLWMSGHEHDHLARQQWDNFFEFQCGNLLFENKAKTCFLMGELDDETGDGQIRVHAWYPIEGWAPYPFVQLSGDDRSRYLFSLKQVREQSMCVRSALRESVHRLLLENKSIYEIYGPTPQNRADTQSEKNFMWDKMLVERVLPNNREIVRLIENNIQLLTEDESGCFFRFKNHIAGLEQNHQGDGCFRLDSPRFPVEMYDILR